MTGVVGVCVGQGLVQGLEFQLGPVLVGVPKMLEVRYQRIERGELHPCCVHLGSTGEVVQFGVWCGRKG